MCMAHHPPTTKENKQQQPSLPTTRYVTYYSVLSNLSNITMAIELMPAHGLSVAVAIASCFVTTWAGFGVGSARKKYEIKYPQMYAEQSDENAVAFNCYQRAHQNVLENYPQFLVLLMLASVNRPAWAAAAGAIRLLGFIYYVKGYRTGNPAKRQNGAFGYIGLFGMLGLSIELAISLLRSS